MEDVTARRSFLVEHPRVLEEFGTNLLQLLLNVYNGTVMQQVLSHVSRKQLDPLSRVGWCW